MNNTIETIEQELRPRPTKFMNEVYIVINEHRYLHLINCYFFPGSNSVLFAHPDRNEKINTELFFIFDVNALKRINHKKYRDCFFIDNYFKRGIDYKGKMYLKAVSKDKAEYCLEPTREYFELINVA